MPVVLGMTFINFWLFYIRISYIMNMKWITLRVSVPKENPRTPLAMEQVFSAAYSTFSHGLRLSQIYWEGMVEDWTSFEIAAFSSGVAFYIRTQSSHRHLFESAIYSQYPNAEIDLVEDYTTILPNVVPNNTYNLFGAEMILANKDAFPIRTWSYWNQPLEKEERADTMAVLLETLSKLKEGEMVWFQILIRPTDGEWTKAAKKIRDKEAKRTKSEKKTNYSKKTSEFLSNLIFAPFRQPVWEEEKKDEKEAKLTPGESDVVKAIENKIGKLAFETGIRWMYIARKDVFSGSIITSFLGFFRQFNTFNLNSIKPDKPTLTIGRQPFRQRGIWAKKRRLFERYRFRVFPKKFSMFNIEELATMYHYPSSIVEAPMLRRVEAKKGEPPPSLPVE